MVYNKVSRSLNLLRWLSWFLPQSLLLLFLKCYILPHFDYCDVVWSGCSKSAPAARRDLGLSTLFSRRNLHLAQAVFKRLSSHYPPYLCNRFSGPSSSHHTRSRASNQLNLPATRTSFGQRAFSFSGAYLWRALPASIRAIKDFQAFSSQCRDFLLS